MAKSGGGGFVLYVQEEWGEHWPLTPTLPSSLRVVEIMCSLFGVHWVMPCSVVELLASWSGKFNKFRSKVLWRMIPHCLMWVIWRERNTQIFDENERSIYELMT